MTSRSQLEIVEEIVRLSPDRESEALKALHLAIFKEDLDHIALLLSGDVHIDEVDILGSTPLHRAAHCGGDGTVELLLSLGAKLNLLNKLGETALYVAARCHNFTAAALLLKRGAAIDFNWDEGATCSVAHLLNCVKDGDNQGIERRNSVRNAMVAMSLHLEICFRRRRSLQEMQGLKCACGYQLLPQSVSQTCA